MKNGEGDLSLPVGGRERRAHRYPPLYMAAQVANQRRIFAPRQISTNQREDFADALAQFYFPHVVFRNSYFNHYLNKRPRSFSEKYV